MVAIESDQPESAASELESIACRPAPVVTENRALAALLKEIALLLATQGAGEFRVRAYRSASEMLDELQQPARDILDHEGVEGLIALPTIGRSIANVIEQYLRMGRIPLLDRLRGDDTAERIFATIPGLGPELSRRIHEELEIETLPELLAAVTDGRLEKVPGIGRKRLQAARQCIAERLRHSPWTKVESAGPDEDKSIRCGLRIAGCGRGISSTCGRGAGCRKSPRASSIPVRSLGFRSCTPIVATDTTRRCTPIPRGPTS